MVTILFISLVSVFCVIVGGIVAYQTVLWSEVRARFPNRKYATDWITIPWSKLVIKTLLYSTYPHSQFLPNNEVLLYLSSLYDRLEGLQANQ